MQLLLAQDLLGLPQPGRKYSLQQRWGTTWLRLPSAWGMSLPLPEDLPALTAHMLRECQLHIGGPVPRADLQELRGEKGWMAGLVGGHSLPVGRTRLPVSHQPLDYAFILLLSVGQTALPPACES